MDTKVFWDLSYGVYIAGTMDGERPVGCVVNSVMQITSDPATIAISVNKENYTHECIRECGRFSINILSEASNPQLISGFGFRSGRNTDKFEGIAYQLVEGVPVLQADARSFIVCELLQSMDCGSHTLFLGKVIAAESLNHAAAPMSYTYYHNVIKGRAPKTAPTYLAPEAENKPEEDVKADPGKRKPSSWVCSVCGYVYEGADIPNDFICPICGQDITVFMKRYQ